MAYTTPARVLAMAPDLRDLSATTKVTTDDLARMIDDTESEINVALSALGYSAPYTEPGAFLIWLGKVATEGAAASLLTAWMMDAAGPQSETSGAKLERRYRDALKAIRDRSMVPAAVGESAGSRPGGLTTADPLFTRDQVF